MPVDYATFGRDGKKAEIFLIDCDDRLEFDLLK
jgi:hypothetical protein